MFDSLTDNGKGVLKLIIKEQINQIAKQKEGPTFKGKFKAPRNHNNSREIIGRSDLILSPYIPKIGFRADFELVRTLITFFSGTFASGIWLFSGNS